MIQVDEDLLSVQRNDVENDIQRQKQRHFIRRNWKMIGYKKRIKLIASVLVIAIPLVAYIFFCASKVAFERFDDMRKYRIGSDGLEYDMYDPIQTNHERDNNASINIAREGYRLIARLLMDGREVTPVEKTALRQDNQGPAVTDFEEAGRVLEREATCL